MTKPFHQYQNPALATDLVIFGYHDKQLSILLLNRKEEPYTGQWTLPGAFLQMTETFSQACSRILSDKLGIGNVFLEQLYSFDRIDRDPRGRVVSVAYFALINPRNFEVIAGQMANDVRWFPVNTLPDLAFDHAEIFSLALQRIRAKILYYPVGFELLNETFTMTELQDLYESILGITIDRRNFRRKILESGYVITTGQKREGLKNRHPDLYKFNSGLTPNNFQLNIPLS